MRLKWRAAPKNKGKPVNGLFAISPAYGKAGRELARPALPKEFEMSTHLFLLLLLIVILGRKVKVEVSK
jgi:hypothetical protein